jgi:hypothetical protein
MQENFAHPLLMGTILPHFFIVEMLVDEAMATEQR